MSLKVLVQEGKIKEMAGRTVYWASLQYRGKQIATDGYTTPGEAAELVRLWRKAHPKKMSLRKKWLPIQEALIAALPKEPTKKGGNKKQKE